MKLFTTIDPSCEDGMMMMMIMMDGWMDEKDVEWFLQWLTREVGREVVVANLCYV